MQPTAPAKRSNHHLRKLGSKALPTGDLSTRAVKPKAKTKTIRRTITGSSY